MIEAIVVDGLAAHRLTRLVTHDRITADLRERVLRRIYRHEGKELGAVGMQGRERGSVSDEDAPSLATLITCPWCIGVWSAAAVLVARRVAPKQWRSAAHLLAVASLAGGIEEWLSR